MNTRNNLLGEYLRARRNQVSPAEVGFAKGTGRKVSGLRREEVALLAGISTNYYLRLEQGRDRNPSPAVLQSVAHALNLDETATAHLHLLAVPAPAAGARSPGGHLVRPGIPGLIGSLGLPAMIVNRHLDILATNPLAEAFSPNFRMGQNLVLSAFLDRRERAQYLDWDAKSRHIVANFRHSLGNLAADAHASELVGKLCRQSQRFSELWSRHEVFRATGDVSIPMKHHTLGEMTVIFERMRLGASAGQMLVIASAAPDSESVEKLASLDLRA